MAGRVAAWLDGLTWPWVDHHGADGWRELPRPFVLLYDWPYGPSTPRPPASALGIRTGRRTAAMVRFRRADGVVVVHDFTRDRPA